MQVESESEVTAENEDDGEADNAECNEAERNEVEVMVQAKVQASKTGAKDRALHLALKCSTDAIVLLLIRAGANVEARDSRGWLPLHAALQGRRGSEATMQ